MILMSILPIIVIQSASEAILASNVSRMVSGVKCILKCFLTLVLVDAREAKWTELNYWETEILKNHAKIRLLSFWFYCLLVCDSLYMWIRCHYRLSRSQWHPWDGEKMSVYPDCQSKQGCYINKCIVWELPFRSPKCIVWELTFRSPVKGSLKWILWQSLDSTY